MEQYNSEEEYLAQLIEQIRCKEARKLIEKEIRNHIEDQLANFVESGMDQEVARNEAIRQMGSPIEVGIRLNQIHRPKIQWTMVIIVGILSIFGLMLQLMIAGGLESIKLQSFRNDFISQILYVIIGFIFMGILYRFDYTMIGRHPILLWCMLIAISYFESNHMAVIESTRYNIYFYSILFIPILGGLFYRLKEFRYTGVLLSLLFTFTTVIYIYIIDHKISGIPEILIACLAMLTFIICKGWFQIKKRIGFIVVWGTMVVIPFVLLVSGIIFQVGCLNYQRIRFISFFHMREYQDSIQFQDVYIQRLLFNCKLFGKSDVDLKGLQNIKTDYTVTAISFHFGLVVTLLILGIISFFILKIIIISIRQKNSLGSTLSLGCGMIILIQSIIYILSNIGFGLIGQKNMPFLSYGPRATIVNFLIIGIILSVYRNTNIIDENDKLKIKNKRRLLY